MKHDCRRAEITSSLRTLTPLLGGGAVQLGTGMVQAECCDKGYDTVDQSHQGGEGQLDLGR